MQGGILWTVHAVLIGMFGIKETACFSTCLLFTGSVFLAQQFNNVWVGPAGTTLNSGVAA